MQALALKSELLCEHYLQLVYQQIKAEQQIKNKFIETTDKKNISEKSGEILYPSVKKLLSIINLSAEDVFVDLGSGAGKLALQVFLNTSVHEVVGVEVVPAFHEQAMQAVRIICDDLSQIDGNERKLTFLAGDFFLLPLPAVSVVFINSVCFTQDMLIALCKMINAMPAVRLVLTLRPLQHLRDLIFKKAVKVECSWDSALCYIYEK